MSKNLIKNNPAIGQSWDEFEKEFFTPEEIAASDLRVAIIGEIIKARHEKGWSQKSWKKCPALNNLLLPVSKKAQIIRK